MGAWCIVPSLRTIWVCDRRCMELGILQREGPPAVRPARQPPHLRLEDLPRAEEDGVAVLDRGMQSVIRESKRSEGTSHGFAGLRIQIDNLLRKGNRN